MVKVSNDKEKRYLIEGRMNYIATMNTIRSRAEKAEARADALEAELKKALEELEKYKQ